MNDRLTGDATNLATQLDDPLLGQTEVTASHFGGNLVFSQDDVNGTFDDRVEAAEVSVIRYPGGTVTEFYFDPADPDATVGFRRVTDPDTGEPSFVTESLLPLSDFLDYADENNLGAIIVVPTTRYIDGPERFGSDTAAPYLDPPEEELIRSYVRTVLESGVRVEAFEVGNEFGIWSQLNEETYGGYASDSIVAIREEIEAFGAEGDLPEGYVSPLISMIMAPYWAVVDSDGDLLENHLEAAEQLVDQLSPEALEAIDAITTHRYVTGDYDSIDKFDAPWRNFELHEELIGKDLSYIVSEWNISARQNGVPDWDSASEAERDAIDTGLKHAGAVAALFHELTANDVDVAAVWAIQQQNDKALATREGTGTDLRAGGKMFAMLSQNTQGMVPVILSRPDQAFDLHAFADRDSQLIVINSRSGESEEISIDMARLLGATGDADLQILTAAEGADPRDPDVEAEFEAVDAAAALQDGLLTLTLEPWEVAVLRVEAGGDTLTAEDAAVTFFGGNGDDLLFGAAGDDLLAGGLHDDALDGAGGDDTLRGNDGMDTLVGRAGDDLLEGGNGDDRLFGTDGADTLVGGEGADTMIGGVDGDNIFGMAGDDRAFGNCGDDLLTGDAGNDEFFGQDGDRKSVV